MSMDYAPRYREIEAVLRGRIARLRPGQRLPSDADLCEEFGVSRMTARQAMAELVRQFAQMAAQSAFRGIGAQVFGGFGPTQTQTTANNLPSGLKSGSCIQPSAMVC